MTGETLNMALWEFGTDLRTKGRRRSSSPITYQPRVALRWDGASLRELGSPVHRNFSLGCLQPALPPPPHLLLYSLYKIQVFLPGAQVRCILYVGLCLWVQICSPILNLPERVLEHSGSNSIPGSRGTFLLLEVLFVCLSVWLGEPRDWDRGAG